MHIDRIFFSFYFRLQIQKKWKRSGWRILFFCIFCSFCKMNFRANAKKQNEKQKLFQIIMNGVRFNVHWTAHNEYSREKSKKDFQFIWILSLFLCRVWNELFYYRLQWRRFLFQFFFLFIVSSVWFWIIVQLASLLQHFYVQT